MWNGTPDMWHLTRDMGYVTGDTWHVTQEMWQIVGGENFLKFFGPQLLRFGSEGVLKIFSQRMS